MISLTGKETLSQNQAKVIRQATRIAQPTAQNLRLFIPASRENGTGVTIYSPLSIFSGELSGELWNLY